MTRALKWVGVGIVFWLFGCLPQPIPPAPPPADGTVACPTSVVPTMEGACDGIFTPEGYACFACTGVSAGCVDVPGQVYCVATCLSDPRCGRLPAENGSATTAKARMKKAARWR